jgi:hypothetical protein
MIEAAVISPDEMLYTELQNDRISNLAPSFRVEPPRKLSRSRNNLEPVHNPQGIFWVL